jgi:hypothetical protein
MLKEQPTAVTSVVTSLLLLGHEPFPTGLQALKGTPSPPHHPLSTSEQMPAFPLPCRPMVIIFCYFIVCYGLTIET